MDSASRSRSTGCCDVLSSRRRAGIKPRPGNPGATRQGRYMSRVCEITGKKPAAGNRVSHANNKKRRRVLTNLHTQRFCDETEKRALTQRLTTNETRPPEKRGLDKVVAER